MCFQSDYLSEFLWVFFFFFTHWWRNKFCLLSHLLTRLFSLFLSLVNSDQGEALRSNQNSAKPISTVAISWCKGETLEVLGLSHSNISPFNFTRMLWWATPFICSCAIFVYGMIGTGVLRLTEVEPVKNSVAVQAL